MPTSYPFSVEVASRLGMFVRPDSGSESCSYILPPKSTAMGIVQSICRVKGAILEPIAVGLCNKPSWTNYGFNSFSAIRKSDQIAKNNACQIRASVLEEPRFVIIGLIHYHEEEVPDQFKNTNHAHSFQEQLARRIRQGRFFSKPVMGWKDFPVTECGTQKTPVVDYNTIIPTFASMEFDHQSRMTKNIRNNVHVKSGVLQYSDMPVVVKNGRLTFANPALDIMLKRFVEIAND